MGPQRESDLPTKVTLRASLTTGTRTKERSADIQSIFPLRSCVLTSHLSSSAIPLKALHLAHPKHLFSTPGGLGAQFS